MYNILIRQNTQSERNHFYWALIPKNNPIHFLLIVYKRDYFPERPDHEAEFSAICERAN